MLIDQAESKKTACENLKRAAFFSFLALVPSLAFSISFFEITSITFISLAGLAFFLDPNKKVKFSLLFVLLGIYFLANFISLFHSQYFWNSCKGVFRVFRLILLFILIPYVLEDEAKTKKSFIVFCLVALGIAVDALIQSVLGFDLIRSRTMIPYKEGIYRITGPFKHANDFSAYLALTLFLFIVPIFQKSKNIFFKNDRIFFIFGSGLLITALFMTYSRGAWVAVAAGVLLLAMLRRQKRILWILLGVALWAVFFSPPILRERVTSLWDSQNGTIRERKILMAESFEMIKKSPMVGLGVNTYSSYAPLFKSKEVQTDIQYAHNGYLQMAAEIGFLGLIAFLGFLAVFFSETLPILLKGGSAVAWAGQGFCFGLFSFLIHSATDTNLHSVLLVGLFWVAGGMAMAARNAAGRS